MISLLALCCLFTLGVNILAEANSRCPSQKVDQFLAVHSSWALLSPTLVVSSATIEPSSSSNDPSLSISPTLDPSEQLITIPPTLDILDNSLEPSTEPTTFINVPTILIESDSPTLETTLEPSIEGSLEPSLEVSLEPSVEPSLEPSLQPSEEATSLPSTTLLEAPTFEPSEGISNPPSLLPTILQLQTPIPTTLQPTTILHSLSPSVPATTFIRFKSDLTLSNFTSTSLDATEQYILTQSAAVQMIIAANAVRFLILTSNSLEERRLLRKYEMLSISVAIATIETTAIFDHRLYSSPAALYANLTNDLNASIASGAFTATMKMLSVLSNSTSKDLVNAEVIAAESLPFEVITVTDDDDTNSGSIKSEKDKHSLHPGIISAIVLSMSALIVVGGLTLYCYYKGSKEEEYDENFDKISL